MYIMHLCTSFTLCRQLHDVSHYSHSSDFMVLSVFPGLFSACVFSWNTHNVLYRTITVKPIPCATVRALRGDKMW
jgi:hypothetical protein